MLQNDHNPALPVRLAGPPAAVWAPPVWRVMPSWQGALPPARLELDQAVAAFPVGVQAWVRQAPETGLVALVDGHPRPEMTPQTVELEPDPGQALLASYASRGLSALRHTEGAWSLVLWEAESRQWLLAVDRLGRCPLAWRVVAGVLELRGGTLALTPEDLADGPPWTLLAPGTHLRVGAEGVSPPAFHGTWRLERRDRRGWQMIQGEFRERLNSVLHALEDYPGHVLLADDLAGASVVLQLLQAQGRPPDAVLWLPGWSDQPGRAARGAWQRLCRHFRVRLVEAASLGEPVTADAGDQPVPADAGEQPVALVSACGLEVLLPARPSGWAQRCLTWRPWQSDAPARPALHGARVVRALHEDWQPNLQAALTLAGVDGHVVWPLLDETVAHFAANLPETLRAGTPWRLGFREAALRAVLPATARLLLR